MIHKRYSYFNMGSLSSIEEANQIYSAESKEVLIAEAGEARRGGALLAESFLYRGVSAETQANLVFY